MIAHLDGTVAAVAPDGAVIDVGGVGLLVQCTPGTLAGLRTGERARVATSLVVREDALTLYGFATDDERNTFELLQTASGVGPAAGAGHAGRVHPGRAAPGRGDRGPGRADHGARHRPEGRAADRARARRPARLAGRGRPPDRGGAAAGAGRGRAVAGAGAGRAWSAWAGRPATPTRPSPRWSRSWAGGGAGRQDARGRARPWTCPVASCGRPLRGAGAHVTRRGRRARDAGRRRIRPATARGAGGVGPGRRRRPGDRGRAAAQAAGRVRRPDPGARAAVAGPGERAAPRPAAGPRADVRAARPGQDHASP